MSPLRLMLITLCLPSLAFAHSGPLEPRTLRARVDGGTAQALATTFGLVLTADGVNWDVICSEGIGYDENLEPLSVHWADDGALFLGSLQGLFVSRDGGCTWSAHAFFADRGVADIVQAPGSTTLFVSTGKFGATNGLFRSDDRGQSFTPVVSREDTFFTGLRFAPSQSGRAYASAWYFSPASVSIFRSEDATQFTESTPTVPFTAGFAVIAVSPADADVVFASAFDSGTNEYVLLRSADAAVSFVEVARDAQPFRDVLFNAAGTEVWTPGDRLFHSTDAGATFSLLPDPKRSRCAHDVAGTKYVCGSTQYDGYALASLNADGTLVPSLRFSDVRGQLACAGAGSFQEICDPLWPALSTAMGLSSPDGGTATDADGGTEPAPEASGCGCSSGAAGLLPVWALFAALLALRARRARGVVLVALLSLLGCGPTTTPPPPCTDCVVDDPCDPNPCTTAHKSVCTNANGAAVCTCDEGYEPEGDGCRERISCDGQHTAGDAFEPDECPALAREPSGTEAHTLEPAQDEDWFLVAANEGQIFRLAFSGPAVPPLLVSVYQGASLTSLGTVPITSTARELALKAPATDTLYFRVRGQEGATGAYELTLTDLGYDDFGDEPEAATAVAPGSTTTGVLQFDGDLDVLSFTPPDPGHAWALALTSASELKLDVLRGSTLLATNTGLTSNIPLRLTDLELLHLRISAPAGGFPHAWTLTVTDLGFDDHGDVPSEATVITPGATSLSANIDRIDDEDVFRFEAQANHIYRFTCTPGTLGDCLVTLRDGSGALVAEDVDGGAAIITRELATAGPYFAHVKAAMGGQGSYTYLLEDLGTDDHGDGPTTATVLGMPPEKGQLNGTANIETAGDRDFLRFTADGDHIYRISCTRKTVSDCNLTIFNLSGLPLTQDSDGGDGLTYYEYLGGGDYLIQFSSVAGTTGTMDWEIYDLFHDDHGDTAVTATPMLANSAWVMGEVQLPYEKDFLKFTAETGHLYRITCQRQTLGDCLLRLFSPAGAPLATDIDGADAQLTFTAAAAGEHSMQVTGAGVQLGTYLIKVEDLGP